MARLQLGKGTTSTWKTADVLRSMLRGKTASQIGEIYASGQITERDLRYYYQITRKAARDKQRRAEKAGLAPSYNTNLMQSKNITTTSALVREIADANRVLKAPSVAESKKRMDKALKTMHGRGLFPNVNASNFSKFTRFMNWARAAGVLKGYSSESDVIEETVDAVINTGASTAAEFEELFYSVLDSGV